MRSNKETKRFYVQEDKTFRNKQKGKSYVLSDFSLSFKNNPKCKKDFQEVVVQYLYRDQSITYYLFINKKFNKERTLEEAKRRLQTLIDNGEMRAYAKYYYKLVY